ncbi:putative DNA ligase (ATP) [Helianthus debilis subsp. tardiflorus]
MLVKSLDVEAGYLPSKCSDSWLKVKRDYVEGLNDSLDLVPIGAWSYCEWRTVIEAGEGFEIFRPDGPLKVDVDFLNDRLQEGFLKWIRYAMKPDEAYGLIFSWDNVMPGTQALKLSAWKELAREEGKEIPEDDDV